MPRKSLTNELLGYPDDARLLIVNADDFGMCHAVNEAIAETLVQGIVRSTSLMVPCPWNLHAARFLEDHPKISFAVHLTAGGDGPDYRWGPVTAAARVPSLVDGARYFYNFDRMAQLLGHLNLAELETEFRAQIEIVLAAGLRPTHLDWHSMRISDRLDIMDVLFTLAREYGLALRAGFRPWIEALQSRGFPTADHDLLDSYGLDPLKKAEHYSRLLRELPEGLSEWAVHPGLDTPELLVIEPGVNRTRQADFDFLTSPAATEIVRQEGIILLDYRPLQNVWRAIT
jgi:hypothetical protein